MNVALLALIVGCCHLPTSESASESNADSKWGDADQAHRYLLPENDLLETGAGIGLGNRGKSTRQPGNIVQLPNARHTPLFPNRRSSTLEYFPEHYPGWSGSHATTGDPFLPPSRVDKRRVGFRPKGQVILPGDGIRVGGSPSHIMLQGMNLLHNDPMSSQGIGIENGSVLPSESTDQESSLSKPTIAIGRPATAKHAGIPKPQVGVTVPRDSSKGHDNRKAK